MIWFLIIFLIVAYLSAGVVFTSIIVSLSNDTPNWKIIGYIFYMPLYVVWYLTFGRFFD